mmetsp:Transcript_22741/g.79481  ORF Transcript_22741/g.79481 Transcript_22741/m.79481 type:complete len:443 (-) Transcript_22741:18-1346(-)
MEAKLRPLAETDIPALAKHANNVKLASMMRDAFPSPYTEEDARYFVTELAPSWSRADDLMPTVFAIDLDGELVGVVSLTLGDDIARRSAELGVWVAEEHWGKGLGSSAVRQLVAWAFDDDADVGFGLLRVYADAYAHNAASIGMLRKCGFRDEAVLRDHHRKGGELGDVVQLSITRAPSAGDEAGLAGDVGAGPAGGSGGGGAPAEAPADARGERAGDDGDDVTNAPAALPAELWSARADASDDFRVVGNRLSLRRYRADDADAVARYADNDKIARWLRDLFPHPYTMEEAREWAGEIAPAWKRERDGAPYVFAIATADDDSLIGSISLSAGGDVHSGSFECGYWLAEPYWGSGLMTEALALMVAYGFTTLAADRIYATPFAGNRSSRAVLRKVGFAYEGRMPAYAVKRGVVHDGIMYAMTRRGDFAAAVARATAEATTTAT